MDLDTRLLRAFVAVVEEETFTDAAIALTTSQASVSRAVQRLEAVIGEPLLSRTTRRVELTPAGERVLVQSRRILALVDDLADIVAGQAAVELRFGYAWAALGEHTLRVQRAWSARGQGDVVFVQTNTVSAGLLEGRCEVAVVRRPVRDRRLASAAIGTERRHAVVATDHPLAARSRLTLADLAGQTVAVDTDTGTTSDDLWSPAARPSGYRMTHGVDEWLVLIASGRAIGVSSEATATQNPHPGVTYVIIDDAPPIDVWLAWWADDPPIGIDTLTALVREAYARA
ncbi:MAG: LysR family transcriptional regulator [Propionibacteriaceae bacterium]